MNQSEVRIHFPLCNDLGVKYLGYVGNDGDTMIFDVPNTGAQVRIPKAEFMKRHHGPIHYEFVPRK